MVVAALGYHRCRPFPLSACIGLGQNRLAHIDLNKFATCLGPSWFEQIRPVYILCFFFLLWLWLCGVSKIWARHRLRTSFPRTNFRRSASNFGLLLSFARHNFHCFFSLSLSLSLSLRGLFVEFRWGFGRPGPSKHHHNSIKGPPRAEERKTIIAGEGKKAHTPPTRWPEGHWPRQVRPEQVAASTTPLSLDRPSLCPPSPHPNVPSLPPILLPTTVVVDFGQFQLFSTWANFDVGKLRLQPIFGF